MKQFVSLLISVLLTLSVFSQNRIAKAYNNQDYDKCKSLCTKHIQKNSNLKQTGYLYRALLYAKHYDNYSGAINCLYILRSSKGFEKFYANNKALFYDVQNSIINYTDENLEVNKHLPWLKKLSKLYLRNFEFSDSEAYVYYENTSKQTDKYAEYKKYRLLLQHVYIAEKDIVPYKLAEKNEILILFGILSLAKPDDILKATYNEIFVYLQNKGSKYSNILDDLSTKYAKKADFIRRPIGNPEKLKKTIDYEDVKERIRTCTKENEASVESLSKYLTSDFNEAEKVFAIYHWIDINLTYKNDSTSEVSVNTRHEASVYENKMVRTTQSANYVLQNKTAVCEGYASLFSALCLASGIESEYVSGYAISSRSIIDSHGWNIVKINNEWYLIDVTWGNDKYFSANPILFNERHYAADDKQLLFAPYSKAYFFKNVEKYAETKSKNNNDSLSLFRLAYVYYTKDAYEDAIKTFIKFGEKYTKGFDYHYYLGRSYYYNSDHENALIQAQKAIAIKPDNINTLIDLAFLYRDAGNFEESNKYVTQAKKLRPDKSSIYRFEAYSFVKQKMYDKALAIADSLVQSQTKDIDNLILRAYVYKKSKQYEKAVLDYELILKTKPKSETFLYHIADCWDMLKDYDRSMLYISKLLIMDPSSYRALSYKANLLWKTDKFEQAYELRKELYERKPLNQHNLGGLAWICILTKRYDDAITYAQKSIEINKKTEVWNSLALGYIFTNQYEKAEQIYIEYKEKEFNVSSDTKTYGQFFLKWTNYLSDNGMTHKDFAKVRLLLK